ncbi:MAG: response regulator [Elusimicrobia bacterium]|nr:response regulator [Elusimicrobiota bacterium]
MNFKILIVDDDKNFIETLKDSLKEKDINAEIKVSSSAKESFELLASYVPDIIILDVQLGDMHGMDFMKTVKSSKRLSAVPVIFISAKYTEPADRASALLAGAKAFFSKPVDIEELWKEISYYVKNKK